MRKKVARTSAAASRSRICGVCGWVGAVVEGEDEMVGVGAGDQGGGEELGAGREGGVGDGGYGGDCGTADA